MATASNEEFIRMFEELGARKAALELGVSTRAVYQRRRRIEKAHGVTITAPTMMKIAEHAPRIDLNIQTGTVLIGSDAHYWPNEVSTSHKAFCMMAKMLKPSLIIMNGDVIDGARISRFPPIGWEGKPSVLDEIETAQERLYDIEAAAPKARRIWTLGNHDARLESRLAKAVPEFEGMPGVHLKDHFPEWEPCWSVHINRAFRHGATVVKHRFKGGIHATHNNTLWSGCTMVTGHLHSLKVTPFTDYNGTRWGVDTGTMAKPQSPQFVDYTEDNPLNWREGFVVLTFNDYNLLWPETCRVVYDGVVDFRGQLLEVE